MANDDLVSFFYTLNRKKATLKQILRHTGKSEASIYLSLVRWRQRGRIRTIRTGNNRRVYELTEFGKRYIEYKSRQTRENRNQKTKNYY